MSTSAVVSIIAMGTMIIVQLLQDIEVLQTQTLTQRIAGHTLTSLELILAWGLIGVTLYVVSVWRERQRPLEKGHDEFVRSMD
jgi:ABC-type spermidine/putrescine transport system permease subunit I